MVGVQVGVDGLDQLKVELADELKITLDLVEHRVDDQRLAAAPAGEQISVGARYRVEKLAEDHVRPPSRGFYRESARSKTVVSLSVSLLTCHNPPKKAHP